MARTVATLSDGSRITDYISLGVVTKTFPLDQVKKILNETGKSSERERDLPAHVVMYYIIALSLFMQVSYREVLRILIEGITWLMKPGDIAKVAQKSGISQARTRLGVEPVKKLHDEIVKPVATQNTRGAWYKNWHLISLDGSTLDIADEKDNAEAFGRPKAKQGESAFPQIRFVSLVENGTHILFGSQMGSINTSEMELAREAVLNLREGMLCLCDRYFYGYELWKTASETKSDLLWRIKKNINLPCEERLTDGSYLSTVYRSEKEKRHKINGIRVRVIEYKLKGIVDSEPLYRLLTTVLDNRKAPAEEMATLYHERWEIETALDELKTHLRGSKIVLRSKIPELVKQEFYGLLMAHYAIRGLMHEAALKADIDPDRLSFVHTVRVIKRKIARFASISP